MQIIDKLLLGLLIALLPIALLGSRFIVKPTEGGEGEVAAEIDVSKLQSVITETVRNSQPITTPTPQFSIASVNYASSSGELEINGVAPDTGQSILISATVLPSTQDVPETQNEPVKGQQVELFSVAPQQTGQFSFLYEVGRNVDDQVIELRLEQNQSVSVIKFDLKTGKQIL